MAEAWDKKPQSKFDRTIWTEHSVQHTAQSRSATMHPQVDTYLAKGCGRCPLAGTAQCKVRNWQPELQQLRRIVLDCGLKEEVKWAMPCYTHEGRNVVMVAALKGSCVLTFFKGSLLHDEHGILEKSGENSHVWRLARFTQVADVLRLEPVLKEYIYQSIEAERSGLRPARQDSSAWKWPDE
ncbi:MAG TPA: DUF1801 domain-containing protein, partial [Saprospiraceae bacterium]|nr:DUF1801 domain-containing protein [Saprospiraceae bacterium]